MSALALANRPAGLPAVFNTPNLPDMNAAGQAGLQASFAVIGYKGSKWSIKYRGDIELLMENGAPKPTLNVVIVGVSPVISKQYYGKKYAEGDDAAPDCFSVNGVTPDEASPHKQGNACATCPKNVWGSRITDNGKKAKACQDSRRIAVVPSGDVTNEGYGGPMLLRLPPTSLANFAAFARECTRFGAQPYQVETRLGFDYNMAYPLLTFTPTGFVTNDETAHKIVEVLADDLIPRMLNEETVEARHDPDTASPLAHGAPSVVLAAVPRAAPVVAHTHVAVAAAPKPAEQSRATGLSGAFGGATHAPANNATRGPVPTAGPAAGTATGSAPGGAGAISPAPATVAAPAAPVATQPTPEVIEQLTQVQQAPDDLLGMIQGLLGNS